MGDSKLAKTPITHIAAADLQKIVNQMLDERMSPRTSKSIKEALRPMFKPYVLDGALKSNPAILIQIPKFDNQVNAGLSDEKIQELYEALYHYPTQPFRSVFIWISHGRRLNEALSLEWRDVNLEAGTYSIRYENNKVHKPMTYQLSDGLIEALGELKQESAFVFHAIKDTSKKLDKNTVKLH